MSRRSRRSSGGNNKMMSLFAQTVRGNWAHGVRCIGVFAIGACAAVFADRGALAQASGKIPELATNPSESSWVRIRADGRNALYGDGWLDPPTGMRGPIKVHPD